MRQRKWLIKINGEDNLYYDSEEKVYRIRTFCPVCQKVSNCICFHELNDALENICSGIIKNYTCSYRHSLLLVKDNEEISDIAFELNVDLNNATEEQAEEVFYTYSERFHYDDDDFELGESCIN